MHLTALRRYPVKSCRGLDLSEAVVEPWGLCGDRRYAVTDADGVVLTAREEPRLVLVDAMSDPGGLDLNGPGQAPLRVPLTADGKSRSVRLFGDPVDVSTTSVAADAWFSDYLGRPARLVRQDDPTRRPTDPDHSTDGDSVSLADGYPMLLASEASLAALNDLIAAGPNAVAGPLPMTRFRPNLVVDAPAAWEEDSWRRIRVGDVQFRVVKACARCVMTLVDPDTAQRGREPLATLVRHRRWDSQSWFAVNLIPASTGTLRVGDEVEVLARSPRTEPLR